MTKNRIVFVLFALILAAPALFAQKVDPIVDGAWLAKNLKGVVVLDIRKVEEYKEGHIPGAVNVFFGSWAVKKGTLSNELPEADDLSDSIAGAGIAANSAVVVVGKGDTLSDKLQLTRVAWTLKYAGVDKVGILDGAMNKWVTDKRPLSKDVVKPTATKFKAKINKAVLATKAEVIAAIGKIILIDDRAPEFFKGEKKQDFVAQAGRVKGAKNLPSADAFNADGSLKKLAELKKLAQDAVGANPARPIITYCDSGMLATTWWYILSQVLGYKNVKSYDGSMQEYMADPKAPVEKG
jgi:thiosulfate/3-mercaptopyruvate sulfurtransferase